MLVSTRTMYEQMKTEISLVGFGGGVISIRLVGEKITDIVTIYSIILWELDD